MKKTLKLIALASLVSVCGSVAAQSSVTVYGRVDLAVRHDEGYAVDPVTFAVSKAKNNGVATGSFNALGFRGVEDLGGGLKAYFDLQHRFAADTGVANNPFWDEISVVGLRGNWGQLQLGRQGGPYGTGPDPDAFGGDYVGGRGERKAGADDKYNNGITYTTPDMGGFSAAIGAAERDATPTSAAGIRTPWSGYVKYAAGPLMGSLSYAHRANGDTAWGLGATYDFSAAKLFFAYASNNGDLAARATLDRKTMDIGVAVPMGAGSFRAKYNRDDIDGFKVTNVGLGYWYDLSKRTMLYGHYGHEKGDSLPALNRYEMGVRHDF